MDSIAFGQVASQGDVTGRICFSEGVMDKYQRAGDKAIIVKEFTTPEDSILIEKADGILTKVGGLLSHAAICAREYGKPCVINCIGFDISNKPKGLKTDKTLIKEGTMVTLNNGKIYLKGGKNVCK